MTTPNTGTPRLTQDGVLALVVERLDDLRREVREDSAKTAAAITALTAKVDSLSRAYVPRQEWEQRNRLVDERHETQGREIADLRTELASKRLTWPAVVGGLAGMIAVAITLVNYIAT